MSKKFKKVTAVLLSITTMLAMSLTAFADGDPTTTAGEANILAYHVDSYVVPTAIKVALNPQGYKVNLREGTDSTAQIVTFNYGLANLSTGDKKFKLTLTVNSNNSGITFVDSSDAATGNTALAGEYKMYLALVPATSTVPTLQNDTAFTVENASDTNTHNVTAANMSDVKMTADTEHAITFTGDGNVKAEKTFELGKATYVVTDGGALTFETTQEDLDEAMEISALGGISGFTLTGAMNTKADWATLETKSLTFTPTYEFIDVAAEAANAAAAEVATATAVSTFKTTYEDVLALTAETVAGTEEELAAINAAAEAFDALSDAAKAALAEDNIDADLFTALAEASEAAAGPSIITASATATTGEDTEILFNGSATDISDIKFNTTSVKNKTTIVDGKITVLATWTDAWNSGMERTLTVEFTDGSTGSFTITKE